MLLQSLAYEVAPFNIRTTIVQPNFEISILTQPLTATPSLPAYDPKTHPAPLARSIIAGVLERLEPSSSPPIDASDIVLPDADEAIQASQDSQLNDSTPVSPKHQPTPQKSTSHQSTSHHSTSHHSTSPPPSSSSSTPSRPTRALPTEPTTILPPELHEPLIQETIHALCAIGAHENPPGRHIVGHEGVAAVKEKLKTVSEELEDFVEVSNKVDFERETG